MKDKQINLEIYWVRHGYSCANLLSTYGKSGPKNALKHFNIKDARGKYADNSPLTKLIEYQKNDHPSRKLKFDIVVTSELLRAIQTGHHLKPDQTIYPIPFIGELSHFKHIDADNFPYEIKKMKRLYQGEDFFKKIDYDLHNQIIKSFKDKNFLNKIIRFYYKDGISKPNLNNFVKYGLPSIVDFLQSRNKRKRNFRILLVSHEKFISSLAKNKLKIPNLGMLKQTIQFTHTNNIEFFKEELLPKIIYPNKLDQSLPLRINSFEVETNPNLEHYKEKMKALDLETIYELIDPCSKGLKKYLYKTEIKKKSKTKVKGRKFKNKNGKHTWTKRKTN